MLVSDTDDLLDGIHRAEHIADMSHTDELGLLADEPVELVEAENAVVGDGDVIDNDAALHGLQLPRDDVGVMLHLGDEHFVASLYLTIAER